MTENAFAWGERGHDLVTRAAVRLVAHRHGNDDRLSTALLFKEHMLGHLANTPDIFWRNSDDRTKAENSPTHYIDSELLAQNLEWEDLPESAAEIAKKMQAQCKTLTAEPKCENTKIMSPPERVDEVGTAPWRVEQLFVLYREALRSAKAAAKPSVRDDFVLEALTHAGTMAHFVADLANPYHTTIDPDGWATDQGGVHSYFETKLVNSFDFDLDDQVLKRALANSPGSKLVDNFAARVKASKRQFDSRNALHLAWALTIESRGRFPELLRLDLEHAVVSKGSLKPLKIPAKRRAPSEVREKFREIIAERLALAADLLAVFWIAGWESAGHPDLSKFATWDYVFQPTFVRPNYLGK